jgi:hypothetical protein
MTGVLYGCRTWWQLCGTKIVYSECSESAKEIFEPTKIVIEEWKKY